jgi:hypothetical protein
MNVSSGGFGRREEADEEGDEPPVRALDEQARRREVLEEQPRQQGRPLPRPLAATAVAPPVIEHREDARVVVGCGTADDEPSSTADIGAVWQRRNAARFSPSV